MPRNYGGTDGFAAEEDEHDMETQRIGSSGRRDKRTRQNIEKQDLLPTSIELSEDSNATERTGSMHSLAESVFSDIRSESTATRLSISNDADKYLSCTAYNRAFPERSFALIVTLVFELPTLFLISGGSDQLCGLIGRRKYTTLIALLPIISAISGNVGLQASTLTTRAISHGQVRVDNYTIWLCKEIMAAMYLGE